jgi:hypothetical protein
VLAAQTRKEEVPVTTVETLSPPTKLSNEVPKKTTANGIVDSPICCYPNNWINDQSFQEGEGDALYEQGE